MRRLLVGVDLGGTNVRTALLNIDGEVLEKRKEASRASEGHIRVLQRLAENIQRIRESAAGKEGEIIGVGVGAPGVIDMQKGVVVKSPNFPDWNELPLKEELEKAVRVPVFLENDANAAALGEQWRGAGRGVRSMILMTLGTGVGGGILLDGAIWRGADGMAGEVGHITLFPEGRPCGCGNRGCLEMYASARGVVQNYYEGKGVRLAGSGELTAVMVFQAAREGNAAAIGAMQRMGRDLGIGIASMVNIFNPEMIVIGGGVGEGWDLFIDATRREVSSRAFEAPARRVRIVRSSLGDDAGMVGAAAVALQQSKEGHA